eukprot:7588000-Prorocentrum_lima.AAC.1
MDKDGAEKAPDAGGDLQGTEITRPLRALLLSNPDEKVQGRAQDGLQAWLFGSRFIQGLPDEGSHQ